MKIKNILYILVAALGLSSCYEDNSATDFKIIKPISIDWGDTKKSIDVLRYDTLLINPIIYKYGVEDNNMIYEWKLQGNEYPPTVISDKMTLRYEVGIPQNGKPYEIVLTVTDKTTGLQELDKIQVKVKGVFDEGLYVADTKDGVNYDVSLIMAMNFTSGVKEENNRIYYDLFSKTNAKKIPSKVVAIETLPESQGKYNATTIVAENNIYSTEPFNHNILSEGNELFYVPLKEMHGVNIVKKPYLSVQYMSVGGKLHLKNPYMDSYRFQYEMTMPDDKDYYVTQMALIDDGWDYYGKIICFDKLNKRFFAIGETGGANPKLFPEQNKNAEFNVNNVGNMDCLYIGFGYNYNAVAVMKDLDTKEVFVYVIDINGGSYMAYKKISLSQCLNIDKAHSFGVSAISSDFFYATDDNIYSLSLEKLTIESQEQYRANPGEKITSLLMWKWYSMVNILDSRDPSKVYPTGSANKMLVISTHNESTGEGKVITMPLLRIGDASVESNKLTHTEYGGFGRISKIAFNETEM